MARVEILISTVTYQFWNLSKLFACASVSPSRSGIIAELSSWGCREELVS